VYYVPTDSNPSRPKRTRLTAQIVATQRHQPAPDRLSPSFQHRQVQRHLEEISTIDMLAQEDLYGTVQTPNVDRPTGKSERL
jgi:hypothetical protein